MLNLGKFILKRLLLDTEKLRFALPRMFPPSDPKLTALRIKNFISTYLAWKYGLKLNTKPVTLQIEPVRGCNLNCIMCGAGFLKLQKLSFDDFKKILDYFPEAIIIIPIGSGEPFLSKDILKMIKYAQKKAIVMITSNFTILPPPEDIINSGLFEIHASIDSFDKEKYNFIRRKLNSSEFDFPNQNHDTLQIVIKNLKNLIYTRNKLKKKLPIISISSVFAKETKEDAEDIIKNAIDLGVDRIRFVRLAFDVPGLFHTPDINDFYYILELKEKYKNQIEIIPENFEFSPNQEIFCLNAFFTAAVNVFGNVFPCCMPSAYKDMKLSKLGTVENEQSIKKAIEKRQVFLKNFRNNPPEFCKECHLYIRKKVVR
jgi:MoaA/NifB/PqqE/SkfB family radical SAM enzyme